MNRKYTIYIVASILLLIVVFIILNKIKSQTKIENSQTSKIITENKIPETLHWTIYTLDKEGISFTYPSFWKVERKEDTLEIGAIIMKIERLSCSNPKPSHEFINPIKIYGYKAEIDESKQTAYVCNNKNTACIDIFSNNTKMTEEFYHSFISTLNLTPEFDKISCNVGKSF